LVFPFGERVDELTLGKWIISGAGKAVNAKRAVIVNPAFDSLPGVSFPGKLKNTLFPPLKYSLHPIPFSAVLY